jgi:hypothetical protein
MPKVIVSRCGLVSEANTGRCGGIVRAGVAHTRAVRRQPGEAANPGVVSPGWKGRDGLRESSTGPELCP